MPVNLCTCLAALLEEGSFSGASARLGISQPYLSQFLMRQEKALGAQLVDRNLKPVALTDAGRLVYESERRIELIRENRARQLSEVKAGIRGRVRLGVTNYREIFFLAEVLPVFRERFPEAELVLVEGRTDELEDLALAGRTDLSLIAGPEQKAGLSAELIYRERVLIAMSRQAARELLDGGSGAEYPPLEFSRLAGRPFIEISEGQALHRLFEKLCAVSGARPRVVLETSSPVAAFALAGAGLGAALVTETIARRIRAGADVQCFELDPVEPPRPVYAVSREGAYLPRAARALIEVMREIGRERFDRG